MQWSKHEEKTLELKKKSLNAIYMRVYRYTYVKLPELKKKKLIAIVF